MSAVARLPYWPAALTRAEALAYTNLAPSLLDEAVPFKPVGPRGARICSRAKLDEVLQRILDGRTADDDDDELAGMNG